MILSIPSKAPPQMNRIFCVLILISFCSGCLRPPWGGTSTSVPSSNFSIPCCTPSRLRHGLLKGYLLSWRSCQFRRYIQYRVLLRSHRNYKLEVISSGCFLHLRLH